MLSYRLAITVLILGTYAPRATAQAFFPVRLSYGWDTRYTKLAPLPTEAPLRMEIKGDRASVYYAYDQFWLLAPFWNTNGRYVISIDADEVGGLKKGLYELTKQTAAELAPVLSVPESTLSKPILSYVPEGWILVSVFVGVVPLVGRFGSTPRQQFERLWSDARYREAFATVLGLAGPMPVNFTGIILHHPPDHTEANMERAIGRLVEQGIRRRLARKNVEYTVGYAIHNRLVVVAAPPEPEEKAPEPTA